jgi:hypothetical protein
MTVHGDSSPGKASWVRSRGFAVLRVRFAPQTTRGNSLPTPVTVAHGDSATGPDEPHLALAVLQKRDDSPHDGAEVLP